MAKQNWNFLVKLFKNNFLENLFFNFSLKFFSETF